MSRRIVGAVLIVIAALLLFAASTMAQGSSRCYVSLDSSGTSYGIVCDDSMFSASTKISMSGGTVQYGPASYDDCQTWIDAQGGAPPGPADCYVSLDSSGTSYGVVCDDSTFSARTKISMSGGTVQYGPDTETGCQAWINAQGGAPPGPADCYASLDSSGTAYTVVCSDSLFTALTKINMSGGTPKHGPDTEAGCRAWIDARGGAPPGPADCYVSLDASETSYGIVCDDSLFLARTKISMSGGTVKHGPDTQAGCQAWIDARGGAPPGPDNCYVSLDASETSFGIVCDDSTFTALTKINMSGGTAKYGPATEANCQAWINAQGGAPPGPDNCYVSLDASETACGIVCDDSLFLARTKISMSGGTVKYGPSTRSDCQTWINTQRCVPPGPANCYVSLDSSDTTYLIVCSDSLFTALTKINLSGGTAKYGPDTEAGCQAWLAAMGAAAPGGGVPPGGGPPVAIPPAGIFPVVTGTTFTVGSGGATVTGGGDPTAPSALDMIFVIDLTSSMGDDIDEVKSSAVQISNALRERFADVRMAIVGYRDWGDTPMFEDYPFTADQATFVANVNKLTTSGGGDTPEAALEALFRGIETTAIGAWRDGVEKQMILMGDAPPHSPIPRGPHAGETAAEVAVAAYNVDPAVINTVLVGNEGSFDEEARVAFEDLASRTGGISVDAASAAEVPVRLREAIRDMRPYVAGAAGGSGGGPVVGGRSRGSLSDEAIAVGLLFAGSLLLMVTIAYAIRRRAADSTGVGHGSVAASVAPGIRHRVTISVAYPDGGTKTGRLDVTDRATIGRAESADLCLHDPSVSSRHAQLAMTGGGLVVTDLGSDNGTFVNGEKVRRSVLQPGDEVRAGGTTLTITSLD